MIPSSISFTNGNNLFFFVDDGAAEGIALNRLRLDDLFTAAAEAALTEAALPESALIEATVTPLAFCANQRFTLRLGADAVQDEEEAEKEQ